MVGSAASIVRDGYLYNFQSNRSGLHPWHLWPYQQSLYHIATDPECEIDLAATDIERTRQMHQLLQETNPRWAPFTQDIINPPATDIEFGPNLFQSGSLRHVINGSESVSLDVMAGNGIELNEVQKDFEMIASIHEPGHPHVLTIDYNVLSGYAHFEAVVDSRTDPIWTFDITKVSDTPKRISVRIDVPDASMTFRARTTNNGETKLAHIQLQRLHIPELVPTPASWIQAPSNADPEPQDALTESERESLEALGYFQ